MCVTDRVGKKVSDSTAQHFPIGGKRAHLSFKLQRDTLFFHPSLKVFEQSADGFGQVDSLQMEAVGSVFSLRKKEHVVHLALRAPQPLEARVEHLTNVFGRPWPHTAHV